MTDWRRQRDAWAFEALKPLKRGPKAAPAHPLEGELAKARQDIARLQRRLERAEAVIDVQKKFSDLCSRRHQPPEGGLNEPGGLEQKTNAVIHKRLGAR